MRAMDWLLWLVVAEHMRRASELAGHDVAVVAMRASHFRRLQAAGIL